MNIEVTIPTKIFVLDDNKDTLILMDIMLQDANIPNVFFFSDVKEMMKGIDSGTNIFLIDYHLGAGLKGGEVANMIKEVNANAEFIFMSSLLSGEEYETLINTCGCNAIARKDDFPKLIFLIKRAKDKINRGILRSMEIVINGKELLEKIENY